MSRDTLPITHDPFDEAARELLSIVKQYMGMTEVEQVAQAIQLVQKTCAGVRDHAEASPQTLRQFSPLAYALAVATILAQMHIDVVGVVAGVVFEAVAVDCLSLEHVESTLGSAVGRIVGSMLRLHSLKRKKQRGTQFIAPSNTEEGEKSRAHNKDYVRQASRSQQAKAVRKIFIAMAKDPCIVLLQLAYRLHTMRAMLQQMRQSSQGIDQQQMLAMAQETREIYAPLAGRLGIARIECELEDLAFAILEPDNYAWILSHVEMERKQWHSYVERVCAILRKEMAAIHLRAEISGRVKHLYSFYKKLQRKVGELDRLEDLQALLGLSQIHDVIAFRILVESTSDCYVVLSYVHSLWKPKEGCIKDFIVNPKLNGYSALHTTIFCMDDRLVEVQIRTFAMHTLAEYGQAIHWHYKEAPDHASGSARELLYWLRQLAAWQRRLGSSRASTTECIEVVKDDILHEHIFMSTPKGQVLDLPVDSGLFKSQSE